MVSPAARVRAVLFDLDGVLIDSARAWHRVIVDHCPTERAPSFSHFLRGFGQGPDADRRAYFPDHSPVQVQAIYERAFPCQIDRVELASGAIELLRDLGGRGILRAVVTNTPRVLADQILERKGLAEHLETSAAAGEAPEKPAPDLIRLALSRIDRRSDEVIYVGDSESDRAATRAAGVFMVGLGIAGDGTIAQLAEVSSWL